MGGSRFKKISKGTHSGFIEEVKQVVLGCDDLKASSPDGYTFFFYKKEWNLISSDMFLMVKEFF